MLSSIGRLVPYHLMACYNLIENARELRRVVEPKTRPADCVWNINLQRTVIISELPSAYLLNLVWNGTFARPISSFTSRYSLSPPHNSKILTRCPYPTTASTSALPSSSSHSVLINTSRSTSHALIHNSLQYKTNSWSPCLGTIAFLSNLNHIKPYSVSLPLHVPITFTVIQFLFIPQIKSAN